MDNEGVTRFRTPKSSSEENELLNSATPTSTKYKNRWALQLFNKWKDARSLKMPVLDCGGLFKDYQWNEVSPLDAKNIEDMNASTLNYWLSKFVMEVCKENGERYPPKTLHGIVAGLKRHLQDLNGPESLNPLNVTDKR